MSEVKFCCPAAFEHIAKQLLLQQYKNLALHANEKM